MGGERGVSPEVHDHLHCFEHVELQVVKTAPDSQLLSLLSGFVSISFDLKCGLQSKNKSQ